ncbi:MAG: CoA transferase [Myxococcales bacterium]|nr:CoA transferase [Myxococcales bacterium]
MQTADLVVESFGPGGLERSGLDFETLRARRPEVSLLSISPWGLEGPWAERPSTEFTLQAELGGPAYRGLPERGPVAAAGRVGEWAAGAFAAVAALAAWRGARTSGRGDHVDLSIFESMITCMTTYHDLFGQWFGVPLAQALELPSIEPAKDGWVGLCTYTGQQWKDLCALMGRPDVGDDARYLDGSARMREIETIQPIIHAWTRAHTIDEIVELANLMRIPVAPIGDGRNVLDFDHFRAREVFVDHPDGFKAPRIPYRVQGMATAPFRPAPRLGADTQAVEAELPTAHDATRAATPPTSIAAPFEGVRIVDLTAFWAGPVATFALASLGADVVKVESIQRPDGMRFSGALPGPTLWEWSPVFHGANAGKRGITLNLDAEEGKALLRRLLEDADVVIENFSVRVMENFGLGWDVLHAINPRLISVRMPAWGLDGPWRDRTGFAPNVEQASGLAWITGYADMPLILRGVCDPVGGMHTVFTLGLALEERERTGQGMLVEVPLVEPALNMAAEQVIEWTAYGVQLGRTVNRGPSASPQGIFKARPAKAETRYLLEDLSVAVATDAQWQALARVMGRDDWARDPGLAHEAGRRAREDEIEAAIAGWVAGRDCVEVVDALLAAGVPAASLVNGHMIHPNAQLTARGFFRELEHAVAGNARYPMLPFRFASRPAAWNAFAPPALGQHNDEVLGGELGLSEAERAGLREKKVIGEAPAFSIG